MAEKYTEPKTVFLRRVNGVTFELDEKQLTNLLITKQNEAVKKSEEKTIPVKPDLTS